MAAGPLDFSYEEVAEFIQGNAELEIPDKSIKLLKERTEGWVAGIQMALLTMKERKDVGNWMKNSTAAAVIYRITSLKRYTMTRLKRQRIFC